MRILTSHPIFFFFLSFAADFLVTNTLVYLFRCFPLQDTRKYVEQVASFLGTSNSPNVIDLAVEGSSFKKMHAKDANKKIIRDSERNSRYATKEGTGFVRKGIIGDWKGYFTDKQNAKFDALYAQLHAKCPELEFTFE